MCCGGDRAPSKGAGSSGRIGAFRPRGVSSRGAAFGITGNADRQEVVRIFADPCKSGETGRIIDSTLRFAWVFFDNAISIRWLLADPRFA